MVIHDGDDFHRVTETISARSGAVTVFGKGEMGKTQLADSMVASAMKHRGARVVTPGLKPYIISASDFLNVWMTPDIIEQAEEMGLVSRDSLENKLERMFNNSRFDPESSVLTAIPTAMREESLDIISLFALRMSVMNPVVPEAGSVKAIPSDSVSYLKTGSQEWLKTDSIAVTTGDDMVIAHLGKVPAEASAKASQSDVQTTFDRVHALREIDLGRLQPKLINVLNVESAGVPNVECGIYVADVAEAGTMIMIHPVSVQSGVVINPIIAYVNEGVKINRAIEIIIKTMPELYNNLSKAHLDAASEARVAPADMIVNDTSKMLTNFRKSAESLVLYSDYKQATNTLLREQKQLEGIDITKLSNDNLTKMREMLKTMDKITLHCLLSELNLYPFLIRQNVQMRDEIMSLARWWGDEVLSITDYPMLARTEQKSGDGYGAQVFNGSIESAFSELKIETPSGTIHASSGASMLETISGGMLMFDVIHVSALDLTVVRNLEVKTVTLTGGLDSTTLNIAQYISDLAYNANCFAVLETRDDFSKTDHGADIEEGAAKIRENLGANSRFAVQLYGSASDPFRSAWIRCKFYNEEFKDFSETFDQVQRKHYPAEAPQSSTELSSLI